MSFLYSFTLSTLLWIGSQMAENNIDEKYVIDIEQLGYFNGKRTQRWTVQIRYTAIIVDFNKVRIRLLQSFLYSFTLSTSNLQGETANR
jgi:hypothetical protein